MKMSYAIVIRLGYQWCHRDDIFGIVVFDGTEVTKLTLIRVIVSYNIRCLSIQKGRSHEDCERPLFVKNA